MIYRVLIVDDEYYIRQRVRLCIPWEDYGFKCVAEAQSVEDALEYLASNQVDLIVVDISMPGRNGLDLIRKARELYKKINFIILSGFSTFAYAKEAIKYDVAEYLLKPINTEELIGTLSIIKQRLDHQLEDDARSQEYHYIKEMHQISEKNLFFRELLSGRLPPATDLSAYGLERGKHYLLFIADMRETEAVPYASGRSQRLALRNTILEFLTPYGIIFTCTDYRDRQVFICNFEAKAPSPNELLKAAEQAIMEQLHLSLICGYHEIASGTVEQLCLAYHLAIDFFRFRAIYGRSFDVFPSMALPGSEPMKQLQKLYERLRICLYVEDRTGVTFNLKEVFVLLRREMFSIRALESALFGIYTIAMQYAVSNSMGDLFEADDGQAGRGCAQMIEAGYPLEIMEERLLALLFSLMQKQDDSDAPYIQLVTQQATELIQKEFKRPDLGLSNIAATLIISPSYLSRNFKKYQGISLTQYITVCRMDCAKCLLKESDMTVSQIAQEVGYQDSFYFSKLFKREYGVSPSRFRKM